MSRSITVRCHPDTLTSITKVTRGSDGGGDRAELELRAGRIYVRAEHSTTCEVSFTNGVVRICDGLVGVYDWGRVDALRGSAFVTLSGQSQPTKVPQGYSFDPASGKIYSLSFFLNRND
ncbi:MAG: hypothetical protein HOP33_14495 [Verrucomicrobia bacterium]|nr:hypothetical protein [Verrucomicrobiota bacterium]